MSIVGTKEIILAVRIAIPPGVEPEQAVKSMSNNGMNLPLGLLQFVRSVHVEVVNMGDSCSIPATEGVGMLKVQQ